MALSLKVSQTFEIWPVFKKLLPITCPEAELATAPGF